MAKIFIKKRREPIELANDRAKKVKARKFGFDGQKKAEFDDAVDLGIWAGHYSEIIAIELDEPPRPPDLRDREAEEQRKEEAKFLKLSPAKKAEARMKFFEFFTYGMMLGKYSVKPNEKEIAKAKKIATAYFKKNPQAQNVPREVYEPHFKIDLSDIPQ